MGFERLISKKPKFIENFLTDNLNQIQRALPEQFQLPDLSPYIFDSDGLLRLLASSPFYKIILQYPTSIKASSILDFYFKGGLIIREDIVAYITQKFVEKDPQIPLGSREAKITTIQNSSLVEKAGRKVKLSELIRVDRVLGDNGEILAMSWQALEFEREAKLNYIIASGEPNPHIDWWNLQNMSYGYVLILLSRWLETLGLSDSKWLSEIRNQITH
jgi:hypothetical protein